MDGNARPGDGLRVLRHELKSGADSAKRRGLDLRRFRCHWIGFGLELAVERSSANACTSTWKTCSENLKCCGTWLGGSAPLSPPRLAVAQCIEGTHGSQSLAMDLATSGERERRREAGRLQRDDDHRGRNDQDDRGQEPSMCNPTAE